MSIMPDARQVSKGHNKQDKTKTMSTNTSILVRNWSFIGS